MRVVQVKCPACNTPIYSKERDRLFYCDKCNTLHVRNGGAERVEYEVAEFNASAQGDKVYMPFWRMYSSFTIHSKSVEGGQLSRLALWLKGGGNSGSLFIYLPATDMDPNSLKYWSTTLTANPPRYATRLNFGGVRRLSASMTMEEAKSLADFVVVTMEAEKPGVLQKLDYSLTVNDAKVVYLPFVYSKGGMVPAL
jgi:endogenous inhibitor of DNA gyrase (YacG/DUF329 family)